MKFSCRIYDVVVLLGAFTLAFCTVAGFVFDFYLTMHGLKMSDTLSRASAAAIGALIVILTNAVQRRYHPLNEANPPSAKPEEE